MDLQALTEYKPSPRHLGIITILEYLQPRYRTKISVDKTTVVFKPSIIGICDANLRLPRHKKRLHQ